MTSEVDIVNLALSMLGDDATVSSIDPPEGSAQAAHAARFYPIARNAILEMHAWGFATKRAALALLSTTPPSQWQYVYAMPINMLNILAVTSDTAQDDYSTGFPPPYTPFQESNNNIGQGAYTPQPYVVESLSDGSQVIYTNQQNAVMRYTVLVTDVTKFTPLFVHALSVTLASHLAGPVLKGETGRAERKALMTEAMQILASAKVSDANQRRTDVSHITPWQAGR